MRARMHSARNGSRAFARGVTLIEVMIVIVILGLISGAVAVGVFKHHRDAQIKMSRIGAAELRRAASLWRADHPGDVCPTPAMMLADRSIDQGSKITDAWDTPYRVVCEGEDVTAISLGPDKHESDDDIIAPSPIALAP
jgi:general secretion pathway protein G